MTTTPLEEVTSTPLPLSANTGGTVSALGTNSSSTTSSSSSSADSTVPMQRQVPCRQVAHTGSSSGSRQRNEGAAHGLRTC
eukprot:1185387-Prorocentrum_minimum.AAC.1